jgi:hypothetical protein
MAKDSRCILVVANETLASPEIVEAVIDRAGGKAGRIGVVAPVLPRHKLDHWLGTGDAEVERDPVARLEATTKALADAGMRTTGYVADAEPLQALLDGVRVFEPEEVVISTHAPERSKWIERGLIDDAKERVDIPITHLIVDMGRLEGSELAGTGGAVDEQVQIFRWMSDDEAIALQHMGFREPDRRATGVVVSEVAGASGGGDDEQVLVCAQVPAAVLAGRETDPPSWAHGKTYAVPADLLNRANPPIVLRRLSG